MKTRIAVLFVALVFLMTTRAAEITDTSPRYNIFTYWVRGPVRTPATEIAYNTWAEATVEKLYNDQTLVTADVGHRLVVDHIVQPADRSNHSLHLAVRIVGMNGAQVALSQLRGVMNSSDNAGTLNNNYNLDGVPNLVYSLKAWGITYAPGGARVSDSIDKSGVGTAPKDEIVFIGMQCKFYPYSTPEVRQQIETYVSEYDPDFVLTGRFEIVDGAGTAVAFAERTLRYRYDPVAPVLSIADADPNTRVGINVEQGRTGILYHADHVTGPWHLIATMNPGDTFLKNKVNQGFYNLSLLP